MTTITVEIWSDVVCPWCYIGKRRWEAGLAQFQTAHPDVDVDVAFRAFQLDPSAPTGQSEPVREAYERKFGGRDEADRLIQHVSAEAAAEGLAFDLERARRSNTADAHRLLVLAERCGVQLELKERLMRAYFSEGAEIGSIEVLVTLGADVGLDAEMSRGWLAGHGGRSEVAAQLEFAADAGIHAVPTFVVNRSMAVPGAQAPEAFNEILMRAMRLEEPPS